MLKRCHSWVTKQKSTVLASGKATVFEHDKFKTRIVHLEDPSEQKLAGLLFRNTPDSRKGTFPILENMVFSGSLRYPVHYPLEHMMRRSVLSYSSSWTGSDFTMFPFQTSNSKDFENLFSVYLDCCFFPNLDYRDFLLQAWRVDNYDNSYHYSGNFYEDLKSRMQDPNEVLLSRLMEELYPGTCYEFQPKLPEVTLLSHSELKQVHSQYYHPSNLTIFLYGNMDPIKFSEMFENKVLTKFQPSKLDTSVKNSKLKPEKSQVYIKLPPFYTGDKERTAKFVKSFLLDGIEKNEFNNFLFQVLDLVLLSDSGLLRSGLIGSGLALDFLPLSGFDLTSKQASFTIGLDGINKSKDQEVVLAIKRSLEKIVHDGIKHDLINSALHHIEVTHQEIKGNYPLQLISSMIPYTLHTPNPLAPLSISKHIKSFRALLAQEVSVLESLIQKYLIDNKLSVQILAESDPDFSQSILKDEFEKLTSMSLLLTSESEQKLAEDSQELVALFNTEEDPDVLPKLAVEEIDLDLKPSYEQFDCVVSGLKVKYIVQPTNGLTYIRFKSDIKDLPDDLRELLPLYRVLVNHLGSHKRSHRELTAYKNRFTVAGVTTSYVSSSGLMSLDEINESFIFKIAFINRHLDYAFEVLEEVFTQANFSDNSHITNLIQQDVRNRTNSIIDSGKTLASSLACSSLTASGNSFETLSVLKHDTMLAASLISSLARGPKIFADVSERLKKIHSFILNRSAMQVLVHTDSNEFRSLVNQRLEYLENSLRLSSNLFLAPRVQVEIPVFTPFVYQVYFTLPIKANFVAEAFIGNSVASEDLPALKLMTETLTQILRQDMKDPNPDGVSAQVDPLKGTLVLSSNRDLNGLRTYNNFEKAIVQVSEGKFSNLTESKLKVFAKLDKPKAVYETALDEFLYGKRY